MATEEEMIKFMAEHSNRMKVTENRLKVLEEQNKDLYDLTFSVKELAGNMKSMLEEQKAQNTRIKKLEDEPAEKWNSAKKTAFTSIVSVIAGALATGVLYMLVQVFA